MGYEIHVEYNGNEDDCVCVAKPRSWSAATKRAYLEMLKEGVTDVDIFDVDCGVWLTAHTDDSGVRSWRVI